MAELPKEELFTGKGKGMSDVYCYVMKGSTLLLADERNKKHLLDLLLCAHRACSCPVYAFCVTDDAAYFITEAEDCLLYTSSWMSVLRQRVTGTCFRRSGRHRRRARCRRYRDALQSSGVSDRRNVYEMQLSVWQWTECM